jgi:membrane protein YdbS with pleckstrin-like domain
VTDLELHPSSCIRDPLFNTRQGYHVPVDGDERATTTVADGKEHALDPRAIAMRRTVGWITACVVALGSLTALAIALVTADAAAGWIRAVLPLAWFGLVLASVWQAHWWPALEYRHTRYLVDDERIEIRRGVYFRVVITVPRTRVQHTDVSQGPVERRFGLGTLVVYTAGTDHAMVALSGLDHGRALLIREHLLPPAAGDAV